MDSETYYIPVNYTDAGKLFGLFEIRNAIESVVLGLPVLGLCTALLPFTITWKIIVTLCLLVPTVGFALIGLKDDSLTRYLKTWWTWRRRRRVLTYRGEVNAHEFEKRYHKIIEAMKELSSAGLIWERRCGRGDANQIYLALVEHRETAGGSAPFVPPEHEAAGGEQPVPAGGSALETGPSGKGRTPPEPHEAQAPPASPRSAGSELLVPAQPEQRGTAAGLEVPGPNFLKSQSGTSRDSETELPEVDQRDSSYIDLNHTDGIHTEFSLSCPSGAGDRMDGLGPWWRNLSEQEQLAQILENCSLWVFDPETAKVFENAIERLFYTQEYRIGKAVLPQANVRSRLWDLDSTILQSVEGKLRQNQRNVKNSTAYTMAVIFNAICESQSDLLLDPYLNSIGGAPAGSEKGGENQCF